MRELIRHELDFNPSWEYAKDQLEWGNILSSELLRLLDFTKGRFFTLLPADADLIGLYDFSSGWILPPNPIQDIEVMGRKMKGEVINSIREEIADFLNKQVKINRNYLCFFEDVTRDPEQLELKNPSVLRAHDSKAYYLVDQSNSSLEILSQCIRNTNAFWHCLFILSRYGKNQSQPKAVTIDDISSFCLNTIYVFFGAYDGEGYLIWEPKGNNAYSK